MVREDEGNRGVLLSNQEGGTGAQDGSYIKLGSEENRRAAVGVQQGIRQEVVTT